MRISEVSPIGGQQPLETGGNPSRQMNREEVGRQLVDRYISATLSQPKSAGQKNIWDLLAPQKEDKKDKDPLVEAAEAARLCAKIAARIREGDRVPMKDLRYLLKTDPDLYLMAMIMRQEKEDPEKWDSLLKDKEQSPDSGQTAQSEVSGASSAAPEGAPSGGSASGGTSSGGTSSGGAASGGSSSGSSASGGGSATG